MKQKIIPIVLLVISVVVVVELKNWKARNGGCPDGTCLPIPPTGLVPEKTDCPACAPSEKPLPKLIDLGAGKCVPCKAMAPILEEMKETFSGQLDVVFIDVWENEAASAQYNVRMIPTQIFFDEKGTELFRHEGFFSREEMLVKWKELGFEFK